MHTIDLSKVIRVYSGRTGCMCGCRGKWTYANAAAFTKCLGLDPDLIDAEDISMRSVKVIVGKVLREPPETVHVEQSGDETIYYVEHGSRCKAVYVSNS